MVSTTRHFPTEMQSAQNKFFNTKFMELSHLDLQITIHIFYRMGVRKPTYLRLYLSTRHIVYPFIELSNG